MNQNIVIGILIIIVVGVGGFAFMQTQNLSNLESTSTQAISNSQDAGTQFADDANASATQSANNQLDFAGTVTENAGNTIATGTQFAENADATASQSAESMQEIEASATQFADDAQLIAQLATQSAGNAIATSTGFAESVNATASQSAYLVATQSALSTDTADNLATQEIELTTSALIFSDTQASASAQILEMENTLALFGISGDGLGGVSAEIPVNFVLFEGEGYEILLSDDFTAGDFVSGKVNDLESTLHNADLDTIFAGLEKQDDNFLFFAIDTELVSDFPRVTTSLIRENALTDEASLEDYIAGALFSLQGDFSLITSDIVAVNGQATGRIIIDQQFDDVTVRQLQYIFSHENQFYVLTFTTPISDYTNLRESLEISADSLRIRE